jgi:hypothetical protein
MFVGYSPCHALEVYGMLNLKTKTKKVTTSRDIKWLNKTSMGFYQPDDPSEDELISTLDIREDDSWNSMGSVIRDSISCEMHEAMKEATEDADSEALLQTSKAIIETIAEEDSSDSDSSYTSVNHGQRKSKTSPKMSIKLKGLSVKNVYLHTMDQALCTWSPIDRALRARSRPIQANSVLDYDTDVDFITMLTNLAEQDEMVMQCLEKELSIFYNQEISYYSGVE